MIARGIFSATIAICWLGNASAQVAKIDGYDGYKFGMTIEQALLVRSNAKQTRCTYTGVSACLEYETKISIFPATVAVQFKGNSPKILNQIVVTLFSDREADGRPCRHVSKELRKLLYSKYGRDAMVKDFTATWASADGGAITLLSMCTDDIRGINVVSYQPSNPL